MIRTFRSPVASLGGTRRILAIVAIALATVIAPRPAAAQVEDIWAMARGGQLYDDWSVALDTALPKTTHPAYPAVGQVKGGETWLCRECHGWDYKGEDGDYGSGTHYTGIKGVRRVVGMDPKQIEAIIQDKTHAYTPDMIPPVAIGKLALFLSRGQIDMDQYIVRSTKEAQGNHRRGAALYQTVCIICHGVEGKLTKPDTGAALSPFGDERYLGALANNDPWKVLHKVRNGQPGVGMVALRALGVQDQVDVVSYLQTLPFTRHRR